MKTQLGLLSMALVAFSGSTLASDKDALNQLQSACALKQVTHSCTVTIKQEQLKGHCVDAKEYGLMCSPQLINPKDS
ncbi:hypothetical protein K5B43_000676 [Vibrio parahaemolyticus]|nr:hypothetical protein [Vibrio parahaemolyticus]